MKKKLNIEKLPSKKKDLYYKCINQFFFNTLPTFNTISNTPLFKKHFRTSISTMGIEKAQELCVELFEIGMLKLIIEGYSSTRFKIFFIHNNNYLLIYRGEIKEKQ